jgi:hypothetical protein
MADLKRRRKSISLKIEHLRLELEEREEAIRAFEKQFLEALSSLDTEDLDPAKPQPLINTPEPVVIDRTNGPEELPSNSPDYSERPEEAKRLWRQIAAATHPDKTNGDPEKTDLYKRANEAWLTASYDEIYRIAALLGMDLPEGTEESVTALESISSDLEKKLKESTESVLWMWGTTNPEKRQGILDIYLRSRGKKRKKPV